MQDAMQENQEMYAELCLIHGLIIGGTICSHRNKYKVTWISPDHNTLNQINDHIATKLLLNDLTLLDGIYWDQATNN